MIHGRVAPGFQSVADAFERGRSGDPGAAQLCVYHEGKVVVDLWSGSDPETEVANTAEAHRMEFGGAGGIASARSVAKIYAATLGEIDGIRLISPGTLDVVTRPRTLALGPVAPLATVPNQRLADFGLGFWLGSQFANDRFAAGGTFGHPGAGGNIAFAHPASNMAVAYTCTGMWLDDSRPDPRLGWAEPLADLAGA